MKNWPLLLLAPSALLVAACSDQQAVSVPPARPVLTAVVAAETANVPQFVGVVTPRTSVSLAFRVGGTLLTRQVETGDAVAKGETLATLDATTSELAVQTARANLSSAEAQFANAAAAEARLRTLNQSDVVTLANLEQSEQQTAGAQAALIQAQARLSQAEEQLSYSTLASPMDGITMAVGAEAGSVVGAGQMVVTVSDPATRDLVIDVPESVIDHIAIGTTFRIAPQLTPSTSVSGKIREIAPQAHPVTRSWRVRIGIDSEADQFWLGTTASALLDEVEDGTLTVPRTAVRTDDDRSFVFVVDRPASVVRQRQVEIEESDNGPYRVISGLGAHEEVVVAGVKDLADGQQITVNRERQE
jgi:RND family efflux transporter MFP subunit